MVFMENTVWFSPLNVIHHSNELETFLSQDQKNTSKYKKVIEAKMTAVMLMALMEVEKKQYWMQIVDDKEQSPDVRTINYEDVQSGKFDNMEQEDVEVVGYEHHSTGNIVDFLLATKFSSSKSYDPQTHILCHLLDGEIINLPSEEELKKQMAVIKSPCPTVVLGATSETASNYKLILLNPEVRTVIEFNLIKSLERLVQNNYIGVLTLKRGSRRPIEARPDEKHYPFESIGYIPNEEGNYI
jgi:hypothetical protein